MTRHLRAVNGAQAELAELEGVIERTLRESFVELGRALARIRDERLYKTAGFSTFEAYCRERWDFGLNYAYKQMAASDAVCTIVQKGLPAPANEAQVRELLKLPEGREEAWAEAVDTAPAGKVTAAHVATVVTARLPPKPSKPTAATPVVVVSTPIDVEAIPEPIDDEVVADGAEDLEGESRAARVLDKWMTIGEHEVFQRLDRLRAQRLEQPPSVELTTFVLAGGETAMARLELGYTSTAVDLDIRYRHLISEGDIDDGEKANIECEHRLLREWLENQTCKRENDADAKTILAKHWNEPGPCQLTVSVPVTIAELRAAVAYSDLHEGQLDAEGQERLSETFEHFRAALCEIHDVYESLTLYWYHRSVGEIDAAESYRQSIDDTLLAKQNGGAR